MHEFGEKMTIVSKVMEKYIEGGSMVRRMFELGGSMKEKYGADNVCDFSLGNPDLPPPVVVQKAMHELADNLSKPASLGYMSNAGYAWALEALAKYLTKQQGVAVNPTGVMLSCGAAGAINSVLHTILEPGDEVLGITPYFMEYNFYSANHGGVFKPVDSTADFRPDLEALEKAITPKTRAIIINSPNNPSGTIYTQEELEKLAEIFEKAGKKHGRPIFMLFDEPYRFLAYDNVTVPPVLSLSPYAVIVSSFSKSYGLAGERAGYVAISPKMEDADKATFMAGLVLSNRTLGFVNMPVVGQYLVTAAMETSTDEALKIYTKRRDLLADILTDAGFDFIKPMGAFYFFPKAPNGDHEKLIAALLEEKILAVPGAGFGRPGHIRLCFAVEETVIVRSRAGFKRAMENLKKV